mmetsp:Transcript_20458/g.44329  ORF Transcript_20458/g.44329 Transcript_20458/m.44329 type:complete len:482 (-) Transcript_20458:198-1643(-)
MPNDLHLPVTPMGLTATLSGVWSKREEELFTKACILYGWGAWKAISLEIPTRTHAQVKSHAQNYQRRHPGGKEQIERRYERNYLLVTQDKKKKPTTKSKKGRVFARKKTTVKVQPRMAALRARYASPMKEKMSALENAANTLLLPKKKEAEEKRLTGLNGRYSANVRSPLARVENKIGASPLLQKNRSPFDRAVREKRQTELKGSYSVHGPSQLARVDDTIEPSHLLRANTPFDGSVREKRRAALQGGYNADECSPLEGVNITIVSSPMLQVDAPFKREGSEEQQYKLKGGHSVDTHSPPLARVDKTADTSLRFGRVARENLHEELKVGHGTDNHHPLERYENVTGVSPLLQASAAPIERQCLTVSTIESFAMFVRVLLNHLKQCDRGMHHRAKSVIWMCYDQNKAGNPIYISLPRAMKFLLRATVGENHWNDAYSSFEFNQELDTFLTKESQVPKQDRISEMLGGAAFLHFVDMMHHEKV